MLVVGAGGLATQLFDDLVNIDIKNIVFWSEVETKYTFIKEKYSIIDNDEAVKEYFTYVSSDFLLCIGSIEGRKKMSAKFKKLGGNPVSFLSPNAIISPYVGKIGQGSLILSRVEVEPHATIGRECLLNKTSNVAHGCIIGDHCEISPGVILTGEVEVGAGTYIGTRAIVYPKVKIGSNVIIAAGAIVKKNIPDFAVVAGETGVIKFYRKP